MSKREGSPLKAIFNKWQKCTYQESQKVKLLLLAELYFIEDWEMRCENSCDVLYILQNNMKFVSQKLK